MDDQQPSDASDEGLAAAEEAIRRAERAWWWVAGFSLVLALHLATGGWREPWLTAGWTVMLLLRIGDAVRARRAEQAALRSWTPPGPGRRGHRRRRR